VNFFFFCHQIVRQKYCFRCNLYWGQNKVAVKSQPGSVAAKDTLGKALYSAGQFEKSLVEFHKAYRMRQIRLYEEWIGCCEETIMAFLTSTKIDFDIVDKTS
jgi:hypothetical protein